MRIGIYGGTFDPIHLGHLILAETCRQACGLDRVWFVVAGVPPHKSGDRTEATHRVEMVRLATSGNPTFEVSERETRRPGPHYTFETLEAIRLEHPDDELSFLIGGDSLVDLPQWREPGRILAAASLVVANRPGFDPPVPAFADALGRPSLPIQRVEIPPVGIASTEIRRLCREGKSIRYLVPKPVEAYIDAHRLYR